MNYIQFDSKIFDKYQMEKPFFKIKDQDMSINMNTSHKYIAFNRDDMVEIDFFFFNTSFPFDILKLNGQYFASDIIKLISRNTFFFLYFD